MRRGGEEMEVRREARRTRAGPRGHGRVSGVKGERDGNPGDTPTSAKGDHHRPERAASTPGVGVALGALGGVRARGHRESWTGQSGMPLRVFCDSLG